MTTRGCATAAQALAEALQAAANIPSSARLVRVSFGEFAESIGGGYYWALSVDYELGNTQTAQNPHREPPERRIAAITAAFNERFTVTDRIEGQS